MLEDIPQFTTIDFDDVSDANEDEYVAFIYDSKGKPGGTLVGIDAKTMSTELKRSTHAHNHRYILVKIVENYMGQTFH